jgi:acyl-CoA synthetase (AMP-forming)/AMP-acid ligase II
MNAGSRIGSLLSLAADASVSAIIDEARTWTAAQLRCRARALAGCLESVGVGEGDRVAVQGRNSGDYVARVLATWMLGAVAVPVHAHIDAGRLGRILGDAMPKALIIDDPPEGSYPRDAIPPYTTVITSSTDSSSFAVARARTRPVGPGDKVPAALIMYTSGSTSAPLGVVCPPAPVEFALGAIQQDLSYRESDRVLCVLPLAFDYGLYQALLALLSGAVLILESGAHQPHRLPRLLAEQRVTVFPGMPSLFGPLVRAGWLSTEGQPELRMMTSTGELFPPAMIDALRSCMPTARVVPMYGMTECKRISIQGPDVPPSARHSAGRPLAGTQAWVGDALGGPRPAGEEGELFVRGPHIMAGYWRNQAASDRRYVVMNGQRTLRTGDIFRMDADGYLDFVRRDGGFLKVRGHRLSPADVEECVTLLPEVAEAVAVGYVDANGEENLAVFLKSDPIKPSRVRQQCAQNLSRAAAPTLVHRFDGSLPRTPNGKYDRQLLASFARELANAEGGRR